MNSGTFVGKLARLPGVTVVPVYFHGQNSCAFQILSHTNYALRIALLFRESVRLMGTRLKVSVGELITPEALADLPDRTTSSPNSAAPPWPSAARKPPVLNYGDTPLYWHSRAFQPVLPAMARLARAVIDELFLAYHHPPANAERGKI